MKRAKHYKERERGETLLHTALSTYRQACRQVTDKLDKIRYGEALLMF